MKLGRGKKKKKNLNGPIKMDIMTFKFGGMVPPQAIELGVT